MIVPKNGLKYVIMFCLCFSTTMQNDIKASNSQTDLEFAGVLMLALGGVIYAKFKDSFSKLGEAAQNAFKKNVVEAVKSKDPKTIKVIDKSIADAKNKSKNTTQKKDSNNNQSLKEQEDVDLQKALAESLISLENEKTMHLLDAIPDLQEIVKNEAEKDKNIQKDSELKQEIKDMVHHASVAINQEDQINDKGDNSSLNQNASKYPELPKNLKPIKDYVPADINTKPTEEKQKSEVQINNIPISDLVPPVLALKPPSISDLQPPKLSDLQAPSLSLQAPSLSLKKPSALSENVPEESSNHAALLDQIANPGFKLKKTVTKEKNVYKAGEDNNDSAKDQKKQLSHTEILARDIAARKKELQKNKVESDDSDMDDWDNDDDYKPINKPQEKGKQSVNASKVFAEDKIEAPKSLLAPPSGLQAPSLSSLINNAANKAPEKKNFPKVEVKNNDAAAKDNKSKAQQPAGGGKVFSKETLLNQKNQTSSEGRKKVEAERKAKEIKEKAIKDSLTTFGQHRIKIENLVKSLKGITSPELKEISLNNFFKINENLKGKEQEIRNHLKLEEL